MIHYVLVTDRYSDPALYSTKESLRELADRYEPLFDFDSPNRTLNFDEGDGVTIYRVGKKTTDRQQPLKIVAFMNQDDDGHIILEIVDAQESA